MDNNPTIATITELFRDIEDSGIRYAVLRNYDNFPDFSHDIDLVIDSSSLDEWQNLLIRTGQAHGWHVITLCDHWADRKMSHLNVNVYRLYLLESPVMLQIDIFHGFSVWSLPLFDETDLLEDCVLETGGRFTHISRSKETVFRILQINSLIGSREVQEKMEHYSSRVLAHWQSDANSLIGPLNKLFGKHSEIIINSIEKRDYPLLRESVTRAKLSFILNKFLHSPIVTAYRVYRRTTGIIRQYLLRPCGFMLTISAADDTLKTRIIQSLEYLRQSGVLYCWTDNNASTKKLTWAERRVMERGGIVLKWERHASKNNADIANDTPTEMIRELIYKKLIYRHVIIFQQEEIAG